MPIQLRVVETTTSRGHSDVSVDAPSPERAAAVIARAWRQSVAAGLPIIKLPDGQNLLIDQGTPETVIAFLLLDEHGHEVRRIELPKPRGRTAKRE